MPPRPIVSDYAPPSAPSSSSSPAHDLESCLVTYLGGGDHVLSLCRRWRLCVALVITCLCIEVVIILNFGVHLYTPRFAYLTNFTLGGDGGGVRTTTTPPPTDLPPGQFLDDYQKYCQDYLIPKVLDSTNVDFNAKGNRTEQDLCPCVPDGLLGPLNVTFASPQFGELELTHPELGVGGRWQPPECLSRTKVVIIIPFRDREEHLRIFLAHMHPILQRQLLDYRVIVVEQSSPEVFNKASMMNIGFLEAQNLHDIDCVVFHDVDMMAMDDRNIYTCSKLPRHVGSHCDKWDYKVPYPGIFGGATAFQPHHFFKVNGFSNQFYGWGGEDDDMFNRIRAQKMEIVRYPGSVARFTMIKHKQDKRNPYNADSGKAWGYKPHHYMKDGLNSVKYTINSIEYRPLYTWILASVPDPPKPVSKNKKSGSSRIRMGILTNVVLVVIWILCTSDIML